MLYATATLMNADILLVSEQYKRDNIPKLKVTSKRVAIINYSGLPVDVEAKLKTDLYGPK